MGYRSQVHFTVVGNADDVKAVLVKFRLTEPNAAEALGDCCFIPVDDQLAIKFYGDEWKWYPEYEHVKALLALFHMFQYAVDADPPMTFNGAFVRIGEDDTDIETEYFGDDPYDLEGTSRKIHSRFDFDETKKFVPV